MVARSASHAWAGGGVGLASLLVGGIVRDMPAGPVEVRIARLTLMPGASVPPATRPYPSLMYIETGESTCPGKPGGSCTARCFTRRPGGGRSGLPGRDHMVHPGGLEDAAANKGVELM